MHDLKTNSSQLRLNKVLKSDTIGSEKKQTKNNSGFNYEKSHNWQEQQNHTLPWCFALIMCLSLIIARDSALPDLLKSKITFWTVSNTSYMVTKVFCCLWASTNYLTIQLLVHYTNNFVKLQRWKYYTHWS